MSDSDVSFEMVILSFLFVFVVGFVVGGAVFSFFFCDVDEWLSSEDDEYNHVVVNVDGTESYYEEARTVTKYGESFGLWLYYLDNGSIYKDHLTGSFDYEIETTSNLTTVYLVTSVPGAGC